MPEVPEPAGDTALGLEPGSLGAEPVLMTTVDPSSKHAGHRMDMTCGSVQ